MYLLLVCSLLLAPATPEEFLLELCENSSGTEGAEYWASHASSSVPLRLADPDTLHAILMNRQQLSAEPGPRTAFTQQDGSFRVEFGESRWSWTDRNGNQSRKDGLTVVLVTDGNYSWSAIPALEEGSFMMGDKERLISGIMLTFLLMILTAVLIAWARRRYL